MRVKFNNKWKTISELNKKEAEKLYNALIWDGWDCMKELNQLRDIKNGIDTQ